MCREYDFSRNITPLRMNLRAKVKVICAVSGLLVCAYLILPRFGDHSSRRQPDIGTEQPQGKDLQHEAPNHKNKPDITNRGAEDNKVIQSSPHNANRAGRKRPATNQKASTQSPLRPNPTENKNIFVQQGNKPVQHAVILRQGIPQQQRDPAPNRVLPQQDGELHRVLLKQDGGSNQVLPNQDGAANQVLPNDAFQADNAQESDNTKQEPSPQNRRPESPNDVDQPEMAAIISSQLGLHPDVKIVSSTLPVGDVSTRIECVPLPRSPRPGVSVCVYPSHEDKWVSGTLRANKLWEEDLVLAMQRALQADPNMMLLDLGSNLGMYALFAAAMGRSVLAVEMLPSNVMMIQKSLTLSGLSGRVLIVNNALFRDHRTLQTRFMAQNIGGSRLNTSKVYEHIDITRPAVSVRTICLDDLVPLLKGKTAYMKIDIENSEHHALACAHSFFTEVNVKVVQIEWLHRTPEESRLISAFMSQHSYALSRSALGYSPLVDSSRIARADVYFLKKSAFGIS